MVTLPGEPGTQPIRIVTNGTQMVLIDRQIGVRGTSLATCTTPDPIKSHINLLRRFCTKS